MYWKLKFDKGCGKMKTIWDQLKSGQRYIDGINEVIFNQRDSTFFYRNVFNGVWKVKTEKEIKWLLEI